MVDEQPIELPSADRGVRLAKLLAIKHAKVPNTEVRLYLLDDAGHPLTRPPDIETMERTIRAAFRGS